MPNPENIDAPITLFAHGRSGTSLLQNVFRAHPSFEVVGETAGLIFGPAYSLHNAQRIVRGEVRNGSPVPFEDRAGEAVRAFFLSLFPSDQPFWMQKPIGQPFVSRVARQRWTEDEYLRWYWRVFREAFPRARVLTMVRHPCDVVISGRAYWGRSEPTLWNSQAKVAQCLTHEDAQIDHAMDYGDLIRHPEATLRACFDALDLPFDPAMIKAMDKVYVPRIGVGKADQQESETRRSKGFSRDAEWQSLTPSDAAPEHRNAISAMWEKFGFEFKWPPGFESR